MKYYNRLENKKKRRPLETMDTLRNFYKEFGELLTPLIQKAYNFALESGTWATTWNSSVITVIHKDGKDKTDRSSYRPISFLNTDKKNINIYYSK